MLGCRARREFHQQVRARLALLCFSLFPAIALGDFDDGGAVAAHDLGKRGIEVIGGRVRDLGVSGGFSGLQVLGEELEKKLVGFLVVGRKERQQGRTMLHELGRRLERLAGLGLDLGRRAGGRRIGIRHIGKFVAHLDDMHVYVGIDTARRMRMIVGGRK